MPCLLSTTRYSVIRRAVALWAAAVFACSGLPPVSVLAAETAPVLDLPAPGTRLAPSDNFHPALIRGIHLYPDNPLKFDFVIHPGDEAAAPQAFQAESDKLITYFLAALTTPEDELWVNLSPYEADRIIPEDFGRTRLGRDMLAQDYLLKQLTASLMYPEEQLGEDFWNRVYAKARAQFGSAEIPMNTFNKVWIVPETATVFAQGQSVYVVDTKLKVMLESDYLSLAEHHAQTGPRDEKEITAAIVREVLIPEIEKEVNTGRTFANLRQIFSAVVLATWYKQNLKESLLGQVYVDRAKTAGIDNADRQINQKIYDRYVAAFEKGVYNYIREDYDPVSRQSVPRKYFSGGVQAKVNIRSDASMLSRQRLEANLTGARSVTVELHDTDGNVLIAPDAALLSRTEFEARIGQSIPEQEWAALELLGLDELSAINGGDSRWRRGLRRLRGAVERRLGQEVHDTVQSMDGIFRKLAGLRSEYPQVHRDSIEQIIIYGDLYNQSPEKFNGLNPVEILGLTLDRVKEADRTDKILVVLNKVIQHGLLAEGETASGLATKLNTYPPLWPDRRENAFPRMEVYGRQPYVLVVDGQPRKTAGLISKLNAAGYEVTTARNALDGLASISERRPDLVITDVQLPGQDGIAFVRELNNLFPQMPVIMRSNILGNTEFLPTMLSAFTMHALPNVVGVPGKSTDGLKTTNLVGVYLTEVDAPDSDSALLIQYARDLNRLGREAAIGVLVFSSVGSQRSENILEAARQRGLGRQRVTSTDSPYGLGSHLIFNRQEVDRILADETFAQALRQGGVPVTTNEFVAFLANGQDRYVMNRDAAAVIKQALGATLPPNTLDVTIADDLEELAGPLARPYVVGRDVAQVIEALRLAMDVGIYKLEQDLKAKGAEEAGREALERRLGKLRELRGRMFSSNGDFDFRRQQIFINNISARAMAQEVTAADRIVIAPNSEPSLAVIPEPLPVVTELDAPVEKSRRASRDDAGGGILIDDPEKALATANMVFRSLHVNRKFDARSLLTMYKNAKSIAEMFGIDDIERRRRTRLETAGGYDKGYVLLRERDPQTGEVTEDNGEEGRLLRDLTLQPRIDAKKVSKRLGDWKEVQGQDLARALQAKLNEEFTDIMAESRRLFNGELSRRERLATVITNFLEAVNSLRRIAPVDTARRSGETETTDNAVLAADTKGGIDLNPANYDLRVEGRLDALRLELSPLELETFDVEGFVPVIINVTPLTNIPLLLGDAGAPPVGRLSRRSSLD